MKCELARTNLSAFMDAALPGSTMADVWAHINSCRSCYEAYDVLFVADQFFSAVMTRNVPPEYRDSLKVRMEESFREGAQASKLGAQSKFGEVY
jgi:predicted anti-sigma-YlaC factor YlaD